MCTNWIFYLRKGVSVIKSSHKKDAYATYMAHVYVTILINSFTVILRNVSSYLDNPGYLGNCIRQIIGGQSEDYCLQEVAAYEDNESLCFSVRQVTFNMHFCKET